MKEKNQRLYQNLKPYIIVSFRSMKRLPATKQFSRSQRVTRRLREREIETIMVERPEDFVVVVVVVESNPTMRKAEIECHRLTGSSSICLQPITVQQFTQDTS